MHVVCIQAVVDILMIGQADMDTITRVNATMKSDAESSGGGATVPQLVQRRVDDVSTRWADLHSEAMLLQSPSASFHTQPGLLTYSLIYFLICI